MFWANALFLYFLVLIFNGTDFQTEISECLPILHVGAGCRDNIRKSSAANASSINNRYLHIHAASHRHAIRVRSLILFVSSA